MPKNVPYVVGERDHLKKIAHRLGFDADAIWNHPDNAELKKSRVPNQLHPGDVLYVPKPTTPKGLAFEPGTTNRFTATIPKTVVKLAFTEYPNEPYVVSGHADDEEGTTDAGGNITVELSVHVHELRVRFPARNIEHPVEVGAMDPIDEASGVRKRLQHLGYRRTGDEQYGSDEATIQHRDADAIRVFQRVNGLEPTGSVDDATKAALLREHGS